MAAEVVYRALESRENAQPLATDSWHQYLSLLSLSLSLARYRSSSSFLCGDTVTFYYTVHCDKAESCTRIFIQQISSTYIGFLD